MAQIENPFCYRCKTCHPRGPCSELAEWAHEKPLSEKPIQISDKAAPTYGRAPHLDALEDVKALNALPPEERAKAAAAFVTARMDYSADRETLVARLAATEAELAKMRAERSARREKETARTKRWRKKRKGQA